MKAEYNFSQGKRGAVVPVPRDKTKLTISLDTHILTWFQNQVDTMGGGDYQALINQVLNQYIQQHDLSLEEMLRRVVREELQVANGNLTPLVQPTAS